ncbi:methionyl-tRNA formyltransferase [Weissella tructae]|uniref:Methionyl-tRNA formyltransferase n=2 Tax=Weissella TaxID=46255 RepID=A0A075TUK7_9LACO|nr:MULTISPECIES: methionyl-tRNA formyltransferase [Weissella]AIG65259.1 Methionyl-tRNA formyltransferase [Weissella tructae]AIM62572.1 Methionyl-tRNA formyltransferase [Weissella ceti]ELA07661.1 methionyl-tRNA formyltransferase [Weissella ceti NC36]QVV91640.1 methionyl-tRNA formyltransferase [Weissella tructae]
MTTKIIFMGTPDFSVPILNALIAAPEYDVIAAVTQPDRPVGRKKVLQPTPIKAAALAGDVPVFQPVKLGGSDELDQLIAMEPDLIVTAAYGQFLPTRFLESAKIAAINVHASLLPKYRGGAPIHYAVMNGDAKTGVSIMYMVKKMDAGDVLSQAEIAIPENATTGEMFADLSTLGRDTLLATLPGLIAGEIEGTPQDAELVSFSPNIAPEEEILDFTGSAQSVHNHVRGLNPFPTAHTTINGVRTKIQQTHLTGETTELPAGAIVKKTKKELWLAAGDGQVIAIDELQPAGKPKMAVAAYLNGHAAFNEGDIVITHDEPK